MSRPGTTRIVATDASVLINLLHIERLDLLVKLPGYEFVVPEDVAQEVKEPEQAERFHRAVALGYVREERVTDPVELQAYANFKQSLGKGEAACLAIAETRGWLVASDERGRFLRYARERLGEGRVLNTPGLLILGIRAGVLTVDEADEAKRVLEGHRFKMRFSSFNDLSEREVS